MVLDNATVLQNLLKQKVDIEQQLDTLRANYMKVIGAIDILQQISFVDLVENIAQSDCKIF